MTDWTPGSQPPTEYCEVLAEVITADRMPRRRVLHWHPTRKVWLIEGDTMSKGDTVTQYRIMSVVLKEEPKEPEVKEAVFGAPDITRLVALLKELNGEGGLMDKAAMARAHCSTLIKRFAKLYPTHNPVASVELFIRKTKAHAFHGPRATSFSYLVSNQVAITNELRSTKAQQQQSAGDKFTSASAILADIHAGNQSPAT